MRHLEEVYRSRSLSKDGEDLGTEYVIDLLNRFELTVDEHRKISHIVKMQIFYICNPWDSKSIDVGNI